MSVDINTIKTVEIKTIVFGAGKKYENISIEFNRKFDVVALVDNNPTKWGQSIDEKIIYPPDKLLSLTYDIIYIMCSCVYEIREQLSEMGIDMLKVYDCDINPSLMNCIDPVLNYRVINENDLSTDIIMISNDLTSTGSNIVLYRTAQILKNEKYNIVLISRRDGELRQKYLMANINVMIINDLLYYNDVWKNLLSNGRLMIVNTFLLYFLLQEMDDIYKKKTIWMIHETFPFSIVNKPQFLNCVKGLRKVVVVSPLVKRMIKEKYGFQDSEIIPPGIPERRSSLKFKKNEKVIFSVLGGINNVKGTDLVFKAIERLNEEDRKLAEFWIAGIGRFSKEQERMVSEFECIRYLGEIKQDNIPNIYFHTDAMICASRSESLSISVIEGFMNEKTVIVSDAAGIVDYMVPNEDGLIFHSGDYKELSNHIHWVIYNQEEAKNIGMTSRRVYDRYFTMQIYENNIKQVLE